MSSNDGLSYAEQHNKFVTSENGTTAQEILSSFFTISLTPFLTILLIPWIVSSSFNKIAVQSEKSFLLIRSIIEYPFVVLMILSSLTIFNGENESVKYARTIFIILVFICIGILVVNFAITQPVYRSGFRSEMNALLSKKINWTAKIFSLQKKTDSQGQEESLKVGKNKYPFITNYRGVVILATLISILAVDFIIFPRRFAKTKLYGLSVMDLGTGSIIFATGIISPEAKNRKPDFKKALVSSIPLLFLGFVRLIFVKGIEYPDVVEEYGRHWNFFFTLSAVRIMNALIFNIFQPESSLKIATFLTIINELFFVSTQIQEDYILNPNISRDLNLIAANREGIFSLVGYFSIYLFGVYVGRLIYFKDRIVLKEWLLLLLQFMIQNSILWITFYITIIYDMNPPCRRITNLSYVLWSICVNYSILSFFLFLNLLQVVFQHLGFLHGPLILMELTNNKTPSKQMECKINSLKNRTIEAIQVLNGRRIDDNDDGSNSNKDIVHIIQKLEKKLKVIEHKMDLQENESVIDQILNELDDEVVEIQNRFEFRQKTDKFKLPDFTKDPSIVCEAICFNGLALFIFGNLLTGVINTCIHSMFLSYYMSFLIVFCYTTIIYLTAMILYWLNISLKFW